MLIVYLVFLFFILGRKQNIVFSEKTSVLTLSYLDILVILNNFSQLLVLDLLIKTEIYTNQ